MKSIIIMNSKDNVGNALEDIAKGDVVASGSGDGAGTFAALDDIPFGFKVAVRDIATGSDIIKYKEVIGRAAKSIRTGECVHIHNVEGKRGRGDIPEARS